MRRLLLLCLFGRVASQIAYVRRDATGSRLSDLPSGLLKNCTKWCEETHGCAGFFINSTAACELQSIPLQSETMINFARVMTSSPATCPFGSKLFSTVKRTINVPKSTSSQMQEEGFQTSTQSHTAQSVQEEKTTQSFANSSLGDLTETTGTVGLESTDSARTTHSTVTTSSGTTPTAGEPKTSAVGGTSFGAAEAGTTVTQTKTSASALYDSSTPTAEHPMEDEERRKSDYGTTTPSGVPESDTLSPGVSTASSNRKPTSEPIASTLESSSEGDVPQHNDSTTGSDSPTSPGMSSPIPSVASGNVSSTTSPLTSAPHSDSTRATILTKTSVSMGEESSTSGIPKLTSTVTSPIMTVVSITTKASSVASTTWTMKTSTQTTITGSLTSFPSPSDMASSSPSLGSTSTQRMADQNTAGGGDETVASESSMKTTEGGGREVVPSSTGKGMTTSTGSSTTPTSTTDPATATTSAPSFRTSATQSVTTRGTTPTPDYSTTRYSAIPKKGQDDSTTSELASEVGSSSTQHLTESDTSTVITPSQSASTSTSTQPATTRVIKTAGGYYLNQNIGPFTVETDRPQTVDGSLPIEAATATLLRASVVRSCTLYFRLTNETVIVRDGETDKKAKQHNADTIQGINKVWADCA